MNRRRAPTDLPASVRDRLRGLARKRGVEFQLLLSEFAIERLLYRLGVSAHAERFVLKGAALFKLWSADQGRATWDLDLLGRGASGVDDVMAMVGDLCRIEAADGIVFDVGTVVGDEILPEGDTMATSDPDVARKLAAGLVEELERRRRAALFVGSPAVPLHPRLVRCGYFDYRPSSVVEVPRDGGRAVKKTEDETAPRTEEIRRARRTAQRLRRLARRRTPSAVRSITLEGEEQPVEVPAAAIEVLADAIEEMARGHEVRITSREEEISTQRAAHLLNVSRPYLIGLLKQGKVAFRMVGTHRRLRLADVLAYKERSDAEAESAYRELVAQAQELGMGYRKG